jgi:hypothetical protein
VSERIVNSREDAVILPKRFSGIGWHLSRSLDPQGDESLIVVRYELSYADFTGELVTGLGESWQSAYDDAIAKLDAIIST